MTHRLAWFEGYGVELEYVLVDAETLDIQPVADRLLQRLAGKPASDWVDGETTWSNELTNHVLELKTTAPVRHLVDAAEPFRSAVARLQPALRSHQLRLLPAGMHPWMDPRREAKLWPGEGTEIYQTYHEIFDCCSHGWANVQSAHLNLPFADDEQFGRLHAAVRVILPLLPALAANSPIADGRLQPTLDTRLTHYFQHCDLIPAMIGEVIPEPIFDEADYRRKILDPIAAAVEPHDRKGVMEVAFLNARGAIARFDRGSIEIRLLDVQETPLADLAISAAVVAVLRALVAEQWSTAAAQRSACTGSLRKQLNATTRDADRAVIDDKDYLRLFGIDQASMPAGQLWRTLLARLRPQSPELDRFAEPLQVIEEFGPLARRICQAVGDNPTAQQLRAVYGRLSDCLIGGVSFRPSNEVEP